MRTKIPDTLKKWKESMLSLGKDMSRAPIISGIVRFPKQPISKGVIAQKIMISRVS